MTKKPQQTNNIQLIWGVALTVVGIGVFLRIPQVMPQLEKMEQLLTSDKIPDQVNLLIQSVFSISQALITAVDSASKGHEDAFRTAVEKASNIWIKDISEKW